MTQSKEAGARARDGGGVSVAVHGREAGVLEGYSALWTCEQWSEEAVDFARRALEAEGKTHIQDGFIGKPTGRVNKAASALMGREIRDVILVPRMIPITHGVTSDELRRLVGDAEVTKEVAGNLLLQEGITQLTNQIIGGTANAYDNTNSFIGVGDTATAEAATQTELLATQNAANRFYKGMVATYPQRSGGFSQTIDWRSDFTSGEANFAWQEWTVSRGATTASGSGFLVGTTNLNRKVQSLGTKTTGTWTMTASITFS